MPIRADHRFTRALASIAVVASAALALAGGIAIAGDTGAGEKAVEPTKPVTHATESIEACMAKWDPGTHMTKEAWRQTCLRIKEEREPYVRDR
ncbi:MAG: hypothetical protein Q8K85_14500 [Hyphomicrobium sp.]|nr:hypothetical protein [Hyphomicrobium sp.]